MYDACVSCHGVDGAGDPAIQAPPIAGLPQWYIESQLAKFRISARGAHPQDLAGLRMRPMSLAIPTDDDVKSIAAYVAALPLPPRQDLVRG